MWLLLWAGSDDAECPQVLALARAQVWHLFFKDEILYERERERMPGFVCCCFFFFFCSFVLFCFFRRCIIAVCAITKSRNLYNNHVMDVSEESTSGNFVEVCRLKLPLCHVLCRTRDVSATAFLKRIFFSTSQPPRPSSSWVVGLLGKHFAMCAWNTAITRTTTNNWRNRCSQAAASQTRTGRARVLEKPRETSGKFIVALTRPLR